MSDINYSRLGINLNNEIPINLLFDARYTPDLDAESVERISIIREIIEEYNKSQPIERDRKISNSRDAAQILAPIFKGTSHEEVWLIFMDDSNTPLKKTMLGRGGTSSVSLDHKTVAREAIRNGAAKVIIAHSHPSGSPTPSKADISSTEALKKTLDLYDISLVDHLVFSSDGDLYFSFADEKTKTLNP